MNTALVKSIMYVYSCVCVVSVVYLEHTAEVVPPQGQASPPPHGE